MNPVKRNLAIAMGIAAAFAIGAARADDATSLRTESSRLQHITAVTGETQVNARISQDFASFAGSDANASSLVSGMRNGTVTTLTTPSGANQQPSSVSFVPPTRPMGNGNVYISLALAKQQLASIGITQPTAEQIKAALVGGTITTGTGTTARTVVLTGVLTQRSEGMGWGNIARSQGVTLGSVISGMKRANHDLSTRHLHQVSTANAVAVSAAGATGNPVSTAAGAGRGHGIVTATGGSGIGPGNGYGRGAVTGMGVARGGGSLAPAGAKAHGPMK